MRCLQWFFSVVAATVSGVFVSPGILIFFPFNCLQRRVYYMTFVVWRFQNLSMMSTKRFWDWLSLFMKPPVDLYSPFVKKRTLSPSCTSFTSQSNPCNGNMLPVEDAGVEIALILSLISAPLKFSCYNSFDSDSISSFVFRIFITLKNVRNDHLETYIPTCWDQEHDAIFWSPKIKNKIRP